MLTCVLSSRNAWRWPATTGNRKATEIYGHLHRARQAADERHVCEAAGKALAAIEAER